MKVKVRLDWMIRGVFPDYINGLNISPAFLFSVGVLLRDFWILSSTFQQMIKKECVEARDTRDM